jgi:hypothetical protein
VDQMLIAPREVFYGKRMLNQNAEEFLIEESEKHPYRTAIYLKIYLPPDALNRSQEIEAAVHLHFTYRKNKSLKQLNRTLQFGWRSLLIAIVFLSLLVFFTLLVIRRIPEGGLSIIFREILIILDGLRFGDLQIYCYTSGDNSKGTLVFLKGLHNVRSKSSQKGNKQDRMKRRSTI